ncbi:MAG: pimeloyl-ACP methyl ester esterase BioH [Methylophilaceae bacterium]|nr:pimeloyl-ACP methyl ester esterase BioH [Methylophilaceae bacterium]
MSRHLHIETHGSLEATPQHLVLIHGWGMHSAVWQPVIKKLAKHFYLHLVDLPGMGFSEPVDKPHINVVAERLFEELPAEATICGWSLGGLISMRMALMQPERVKRLILVSSTPCFVNKSGKAAWQDGIDADVFRDFALQVSVDYQTTMLKFLTLQCMGSSDTRSIIKQLRESFAERPTPTVMTLQSALRILLENDLRPHVAMLKQPTLLIHGDRDTLAPVQAANWMSQHLPDAHLRVIAGASHAPFLSHTEQFTDTLLQFLEPTTP